MPRINDRHGALLPVYTVFAFLALILTSSAQLGSGLVNYWDFDGQLVDKAHGNPLAASTVADDGTFDGVNGTDGIDYAAGLFGDAIELNGASGGVAGFENDGFVRIPRSADTLFGANATNPTAPNTVSISVWINSAGFDQSWQTIISHGEGAQYRLARRAATNFVAHAGGVGEGPEGTADISTGWHHIVGVSDGAAGATFLYVDGVLDSTGGVPVIDDARTGGTLDLFIGGNPDTGVNNREWHGMIDDVGIWNRALTATEVTDIFNAGTNSGQSLGILLDPNDDDADGLPNAWEVAFGLDPNSNVGDDGTNGDPDGDMLTNEDEFDLGTDPSNPDTDGDGYNDFVETNSGTFVAVATDTGTDPLNDDTDGDGLLDGVENNDGSYTDGTTDSGTHPLIVDTDTDGRPDGYEANNGQNPLDATDGALDPDADGSDNAEEFARNTDPTNNDTDGDTLLDGVESGSGTYVGPSDTGTNPLLADTDADGLDDNVEDPALPFVDANQPGTDPTLNDTDGDGFGDGTEIANGANPTDANSLPALPNSLGVSTASLIGMDLTDPESDGDPENDLNYNAVFASSEEPGFAGGEFAFNVFDNLLGPGNDKWCCGSGAFPLWVQATFPNPIILTEFTVASGNDSPDRDPRVWEMQGSNDGVTFETIFRQDDPLAALWTQRLEVMHFIGGVTYAMPSAYTTFRLAIFETGIASGAVKFQLGEIELFGTDNVTPLAITDIQYDTVNDMITLIWPSEDTRTYAIYYSTDLVNWGADLDDSYAGDAGLAFTTFSFANPEPGEPKLFFRVEQN